MKFTQKGFQHIWSFSDHFFLQKTRLILFFIFVICQLSSYILPDQNIETQEI